MNESRTPSTSRLPVLPVRDRVAFPNVHVSLVVGRERSMQAVRTAFAGDRLIFVTAQRHMKVEEPGREDLFEYGTVAEILQMVNLPDGILRIRVLGRHRARLLDLSTSDGTLWGDIQPVEVPSVEGEEAAKLEAMRRLAVRKFEEYAKKIGRVPAEAVTAAADITSLDRLADTISDAILVSVEEKQDLIEIANVPKRLSRLVEILDAEIEILNIERKIQMRVHRQIEKNQKEYYLNEQMRAIQKELKKKDDNGREMDDFRAKVQELKMPAEAAEVAMKEIERLEKMMPYSPEATVARGYLEWLTGLPWNTLSKDTTDVKTAREILEKDHFGLEKPKERLLEYLAVLKLTHTIKGPVLCFVGPPGVGKTSLAKSLARAMGREFVRISLGGVRDEAEIRGHRRTYIGSMPGRLIQSIKKAKTKNPVILLDEIDKMGTDWRGDPAAALLEVLDPEQNKSFVDHYLDVGFDLSNIIFITTANSLYGIPATLQDRMEVIRFSAYTTDEKVAIANKYLIPKELKEHGLPASALKVDDEALRKIIHIYTQEAGVRELQRKIAQVCRKVAVEWVQTAEKKHKTIAIGMKDLAHYLGAPDFVREKITVNAVGVSTGLAWTDHGGETLTIEVTTMPGQGKVLLTGKLGAVMQESAQAALSLVRSRASRLGVKIPPFNKLDIHLHVPEGAIPKDGPSAGTAIATAIFSALAQRPVRKDIAMTGELTLRGRVLPIGGLKEKLLAAFREGLKTVLFPVGNEKDLPEVPENVRKALKLVPVASIDDVFRLAVEAPAPKAAAAQKRASLRPSAN
ncbi:MAG: endopeptidase La [Elusimicrobia bacterium]|nr:endopeptidase La [Elusimicrobiota bacterium]